jgi:glycosyltransferase involved in cell wall biosynthesis
VGIPTYNRPEKLQQAISSVLGQSLQDVEVIVSDDGTSAETERCVRAFGDRRVRYVRNAPALGVPGNWNRCVQLAEGEFFTLLPDDDVLLPAFAKEAVSALRAHPAAGLAIVAHFNVDEKLRPIQENVLEPRLFMASGADALEKLLTRLVCVPASVACRRTAMLDCGLWRSYFWDDWALFLRVAFHHGFVYIPQLLAAIRFHESNLAGTLAAGGRDEVLDLINQTLDVFGTALPASERLLAFRARCERTLSYACMLKTFKGLLRGQPREARRQFGRARSLHALAGLDPRFLGLWRTHRKDAARVRAWRGGRRLSDQPVLSLAARQHAPPA